MTKYEVTLTVPNIGKVKHVIRAENRDDAKDRAKAAHPTATVVKAAEVKG